MDHIQPKKSENEELLYAEDATNCKKTCTLLYVYSLVQTQSTAELTVQMLKTKMFESSVSYGQTHLDKSC